MKRLKKRLLTAIKAFIVKAVVEDYGRNGETRRVLKQNQDWPALFGSPGSMKVIGPVRAGNAFPVGNSSVTDTQ